MWKILQIQNWCKNHCHNTMTVCWFQPASASTAPAGLSLRSFAFAQTWHADSSAKFEHIQLWSTRYTHHNVYSMYVYIHANIRLFTKVYMYIWIYTYVYIYIHIYICIHICKSYVYMDVDVCHSACTSLMTRPGDLWQRTGLKRSATPPRPVVSMPSSTWIRAGGSPRDGCLWEIILQYGAPKIDSLDSLVQDNFNFTMIYGW